MRKSLKERDIRLNEQGNWYCRAKGVMMGKASSRVLTFSAGFVWDLDLYILFTSRIALYNQMELKTRAPLFKYVALLSTYRMEWISSGCFVC